jgi:malate synthase
MSASLELEITAPPVAPQVLAPDAVAFVAELVARFGPALGELVERRRRRQAAFDAGELPDFLDETRSVRESDWTVAPPTADLARRIVEITGPVDRKMIINALGSGADVFMADFEDSSAPTWEVVIGGQQNLIDAVRRTIDFTNAETGKRYSLPADENAIATLFVRPRGLHLVERHVLGEGGAPISGSLLDFGLFCFHNAAELLARGSGPYFYLPKLESHLEARWWNEVFTHTEERLGLAPGSIRATVLIETLPAVFEMDEILYELRHHSAGLNCGRWDYIFSYIKTLRNRAEFVIPDRAEVGMTQPNMRAYTQLLIQTCHRRGAFAMGGMAAQIPIKDDPEANAVALEKVRRDKEREAKDGHDGTWVAHPGLIEIARAAFREVIGDAPNQLGRLREDVSVTASDLLTVPRGKRTDESLRANIRVGIRYLESWLRGVGCVPIYNLMEDAATAEISRTQIWQWLRHNAATDDGEPVTAERIARTTEEEMKTIAAEVGERPFAAGRFEDARRLFSELATDTTHFTEFLTLPAYRQLCATEHQESNR